MNASNLRVLPYYCGNIPYTIQPTDEYPVRFDYIATRVIDKRLVDDARTIYVRCASDGLVIISNYNRWVEEKRETGNTWSYSIPTSEINQ